MRIGFNGTASLSNVFHFNFKGKILSRIARFNPNLLGKKNQWKEGQKKDGISQNRRSASDLALVGRMALDCKFIAIFVDQALHKSMSL